MPDPRAADPVPRWQRSAWLLATVALWVLAATGTRALLLPDEGRYAAIAYGMLHGDLLVPRLNGLPFFHKPPLMYWIDAAAMRLFGVNEFGARAAPLVGALLMAWAMAYDLQRRTGARRAALALGALATMPFFYFGAQYANHDMLVAGLVTIAIVAGARAGEPDAPLRWVGAAWAAAALAVLAKGLIGIVLPALVLLPWLAWRRQWRALLRLVHPLGPALFALVAVPWFAAMQARYPGFAEYFFVEQHLRRYAQGGFNNVQPFWFYVAVLPLLTLPWSLALVASRRRPADNPVVAFYAWWVLAVLLFFSLPRSKLVGYVLAALGPFAALLALAATRGTRTRAWRWGMVLGVLVCLFADVGIARMRAPSQRDIGRVLAERMQAGDRVVLVDAPFYDVPFYARLAEPPIVLADWNAPGFAARDDWRKELRDAARFEPALGARLLWPLERTAELGCGVARVWWVAPRAWQPPAAAGLLTPVLRSRSAVLWQSAGRQGSGCP